VTQRILKAYYFCKRKTIENTTLLKRRRWMVFGVQNEKAKSNGTVDDDD
jgi:hypothetical protein